MGPGRRRRPREKEREVNMAVARERRRREWRDSFRELREGEGGVRLRSRRQGNRGGCRG